MIGTDKQIIEALKVQRNQYADDCAELKAAWDACKARIAQLERELVIARMPEPEDGGHQGPSPWAYPLGNEMPMFHTPARDETGPIAP